MQKVIGLLGVKGSGKDTAAKYLVLEQGYERIGFADTLYREAAEAFGVTVEFLGNRETKEKELPELELARCKDPDYVACVAYHLGHPEGLVPEEMAKPRSPRFILQFWGTEYRRKGAPGLYVGDDSYWLNRVKDAMEAKPGQSFVITDVRFLNEFNFVRQYGGQLMRVRRPHIESLELMDRASSGRAAHASETELLHVEVDAELLNEEGNPDSLRDALMQTFELPA